jgi:hypothetical protein
MVGNQSFSHPLQRLRLATLVKASKDPDGD